MGRVESPGWEGRRAAGRGGACAGAGPGRYCERVAGPSRQSRLGRAGGGAWTGAFATKDWGAWPGGLCFRQGRAVAGGVAAGREMGAELQDLPVVFSEILEPREP